MTTIKFHPAVLSAHAQFGGDLESMQKCFDWYDLQAEAARLRKAMQEACDLLTERTHGNAARSPGHNARVVLEWAMKEGHTPPPQHILVGSKPVAWTTKGNLETLASSPKEARYMWGLPSGSTISAPLYASPQAPAEHVAGWKVVPAEATRELLDDCNGKPVLCYENGTYYNAWIEFEPLEGGYVWINDADSEPSPSHYCQLPAAPERQP